MDKTCKGRDITDWIAAYPQLCEIRKLRERGDIAYLIIADIQSSQTGQSGQRAYVADEVVMVQRQMREIRESGQGRNIADLVVTQMQAGQLRQSGKRRDIADLIDLQIQVCQVRGVFETCDAGDPSRGNRHGGQP